MTGFPRIYHAGRFLVFWAPLEGGRGLVDLHIDEHLLTDKQVSKELSELAAKTLESLERILKGGLKRRRQQQESGEVEHG